MPKNGGRQRSAPSKDETMSDEIGDPCDSCGMKESECRTRAIAGKGDACCVRCADVDTHHVIDQDETTGEVGPADGRFAAEVNDSLAVVGALLVGKNESYGDSALNPVRIFSDADPVAGLRLRIDDKLSRIKRGNDYGEDTVLDLIGYLVMLRIAERRNDDRHN